MKPLKGFDLLRPRTLVGALEALNTLELAQPIAGGTDLIPTFRDLGCKPKYLIDLSLIQELSGIHEEEGFLNIGATTTHSQILSSKLVEEKVKALHEACRWIGSVQIRNRGTIGGNICNASPAADTATPLLVHAAEAHIASLNDTRWIPIQDMFAGPKVTVLEPNELLIELRLPIVNGAGSSFHRIGRRKGFTLSVVNTAAYLERDSDKVKEIRIALGSIAPTPLTVQRLDEHSGKKMNESFMDKVIEICLEQIKPIDDVRGTAEYRRDMTLVLVRRALHDAWVRCGGS